MTRDDADNDTYGRPGVDLRLLLPFVVLADELHFGRAARHLHLTQSALSQQLQRLEKQLGVALVARDSRRVALTPAGHVFLAGARHALQSAASAAREAQQAAAEQATVRIGVDIELPDALVRRLRLFGSGRPDLAVRLRIQQQDDVVADLEAGRSDVAIGWAAPPASAEGLMHAVLTTVELHGVVQRDDPIAAGPGLSRDRLAGLRLVTYRPSRETRAFYDFFLAEFISTDGSAPAVAHIPVLDDAQAAMLDEVERSGGFTFCVAGDFGRFGRSRLVARPFAPALHTDVVMMWRGTRRPSLLTGLAKSVTGWDQPAATTGA